MGILNYLKSIFTGKNNNSSTSSYNTEETNSLEAQTKVEEPTQKLEELAGVPIVSDVVENSQDVAILKPVKDEITHITESSKSPKVGKNKSTKRKPVKVEQKVDKKSEKPKRSTKKKSDKQ